MQRKLTSTDPRRRAILSRLRLLWRHLPRTGRLLFFDVQPITVKAYGGRRYTRARRLVLARRQKIRGRFYLLLIYEVNTGRVRWSYAATKDTAAICRLMHQVRRWYPTQTIWVALDQDRAHPRTSRATRRVMRALGLHWISLPKASPDDNPVEWIFSDLQLRVLDNSDDPDPGTTRHRISAHLRGRNRRRDRRLRIHYLEDTTKH